MVVRRLGNGEVGLVALHGFTQQGRTFGELAGLLDHTVMAPDLPGHGATEVTPVTIDSTVGSLISVLESAGRPLPMLGYSQGGRLALLLALHRPDLVERLILVSASPGISGSVERASRRDLDERLAGHIEEVGIEVFIDEWLALPMFAGLKNRSAEWVARDRALRLENTAAGLAAALRGLGQGVQPHVGHRLRELRIPVLLIAGALDEKYRDLTYRMESTLPDATVSVFAGAGHAVIGEQPEAVAEVIRTFLPA
jgi:2-succinyl-6-hydroxy-2,4-cyclohexadiene-1-carboxylate synthase